MVNLTEQCLELPYIERVALCAALRESIIQEKGLSSPPNRGTILLEYMEEVMGEKILLKCREPKYVWARTMVAYQLLQEGFSTTDAGRMVGKDHSTILNMKKNMKNALEMSFAYKDIIEIWVQFKNKVDNEIHRRTTQDSLQVGGTFPDGC